VKTSALQRQQTPAEYESLSPKLNLGNPTEPLPPGRVESPILFVSRTGANTCGCTPKKRSQPCFECPCRSFGNGELNESKGGWTVLLSGKWAASFVTRRERYRLTSTENEGVRYRDAVLILRVSIIRLRLKRSRRPARTPAPKRRRSAPLSGCGSAALPVAAVSAPTCWRSIRFLAFSNACC
jgi:hypothetical protein